MVIGIAALALGCGGPLASYAETIRDPTLRREVAAALGELESLRQEGWITRIARGECRRTHAAPESAASGEVIGALATEPTETTPAACRDALDALDRLGATRARLERERDESGVLDAFRRAVRGDARLPDECPTVGDAVVPIAAAVARHVSELSVWAPAQLEVPGATSSCRVATLTGSILVAAEAGTRPRARIGSVLVLRGDALRGGERAAAEGASAPPPIGAFDFADDGTWVVAPQSGPWSNVPAVQVELWSGGELGGSIEAYLVVRASDGWRVVDSIHVGDT